MRVFTCCVLVLGSTACFLDPGGNDELARQTGRDDDSVTAKDAGPGQSDDASVPSEVDSGPEAPDLPEFPYRWRANGPNGSAQLGQANFFLACEDMRTGAESDDCGFLCRSESGTAAQTSCDPIPAEPCAEVVSGLGQKGTNRFCVTVLQPANDETRYRTNERTDCWEWESEPFPYQVVVGPIQSNSTKLDVKLACQRKDPAAEVVGERLNCLFQCSLDREPYSYCGARYTRNNVAPGDHVLRVRADAAIPPSSLDFFLSDALTIPFTIADTAAPPFEPPSLPATLPVSELGVLGDLVEPYMEYAHDCAGARRETASYAFVKYASMALGRGVVPDPDLVGDCRAELERLALDDIPLDTCLEAMGIGDDVFWIEPVLPARLPFACMMLSLSPPTLSGECFTHAECQAGICQPLSSLSPLGVCFSADPGEGSLCSAAGCEPDLYCDGVCRPRQPEGATCISDYECLHGAVCANDRCIQLRCAGDTCTDSAQCSGGSCIDQRCQDP